MKTAVMYGAGNIGRGFIAQVFHDSGFQVVFVDINKQMIEALNEKRCYTQLIVSGESVQEQIIDNVRAVNGEDSESVAEEIARCDIMAVSVGARILPYISANIAKGIAKRIAAGYPRPLNILICENLLGADDVLRKLLLETPDFKACYLEQVGLVMTTIGRMVPVMPPELMQGDVTRIAVEPFCQLPMDKAAFVGDIPEIAHGIPYEPFAFFEEKKLFIHNMGHALIGYLGYLKGYDYIWQAAEDMDISARAKAAMTNVARALAKEYAADPAELFSHVNDLISRFKNRALADTVTRVCADPLRKLGSNDRFIGAVRRCKANGIDCEPILYGVAAALCFNAPDDISASKMQEQISLLEPERFLQEYSGLSKIESKICAKYYNIIKQV